MTHERRQALTALIRAGHDLLARAEAGEWARLAAVEARHRRQAETFFSVTATPAETDELAQGLRELLDIQDRVTVLAVRERDHLQGRIHEVRQGRRAVAAYGSTVSRPLSP